MYKDLQRTRVAIVSLIKSFLSWCSRCRRRLLKVPGTLQTHGNVESFGFPRQHGNETQQGVNSCPGLQFLAFSMDSIIMWSSR